MILVADSSHGYQIIDLSRHSAAKCLNDEKTHSAIINKLFKRFDHIHDQLFDTELPKSKTEHKELVLVGFILCSILNWLQLYYNFYLQIFAIQANTKKMEMDTGYLCLALTEKDL